MTSGWFGTTRRCWAYDTEFYCPDGERPETHCAVFQDARTGETIRFRRGDFLCGRAATFLNDTHEDLFVDSTCLRNIRRWQCMTFPSRSSSLT